MSRPTAWGLGLFLVANALAGYPGSPAAQHEAREIAALAGFHGGLVIHVGCGDGNLTAALRLGSNSTVQGLAAHASQVEAARACIRSLGLYGPVSVMRWTAKELPYVDNLATLVVCGESGAVSADEMMRVLRPRGAAVAKKNGKWTVAIKPQPKNTDEWQQHYHGADNNAVAQDSVVGPPRRFQWINEPQWQRAHLSLPSLNSMVSACGRLFTIEDLASAEHPALPGKFALVARDAYNGIVLWRAMFPDWLPSYVRDKEMPVQIQRRLAAIGDLVYCTPGYAAPITVFDAATGAVRQHYAGTTNTMEFVHDRGVLFVVTGDPYDVSTALINPSLSSLRTSLFTPGAYGPAINKPKNPQNDLLAIDAESGKELWRKSGADTQAYEGASLGLSGVHLVYATRQELVCLERMTGKTLWRIPAAVVPNPVLLKRSAGLAVSLVLSEHAVYLADSEKLRAFSLADGQALWSAPVAVNHYKPPDVFLAGGLVWTAAYDASIGRPAPERGLARTGVNGFDPLTGKLIKQVEQAMNGPMLHDRCYRNRITTQYYINSATGGSDFLGLDSPAEFPNPWIRSTCGIGPLPCNGLYYVGPPACSCSSSVMLNAFNALAAEPGLAKSDQPIKVGADGLLEKGPASGETSNLEPQISDSAGTSGAISNLKSEFGDLGDWPTYRHDTARSGTSKIRVPAQLTRRWETKLGTRVSAPVIAQGLVFVAEVDGHAVCALDQTNGNVAWRFTAEGRVDSPPTCYQGLVLFGSRDGSVYCLRHSDGMLVWRFLPLERRIICAYGQPESAWPVSGSILIHDGLAYFAAGRDSFTDGGLFLYALDPRTGKVLHQQHVYGPFGHNGFPIEESEALGNMSIEGCKADIFQAGAKLLFLRHQAFTPDLSPVKPEDINQPHLIPSPGFLEAIPQHRSFWTIDTALRRDSLAAAGGVHGDILVLDGTRFYEVRGYTPGLGDWFDPRTAGYTLFAGTWDTPAPPAGAAAPSPKQKRKSKVAAPLATARSTKLWSTSISLTGKAMALVGDILFVAGTPVAFPEDDLAKAYEGRMGGVLWAVSASTGEKLASYALDAPPVWDSLAAASGMLLLSLADGRVACWRSKAVNE